MMPAPINGHPGEHSQRALAGWAYRSPDSPAAVRETCVRAGTLRPSE